MLEGLKLLPQICPVLLVLVALRSVCSAPTLVLSLHQNRLDQILPPYHNYDYGQKCRDKEMYTLIFGYHFDNSLSDSVYNCDYSILVKIERKKSNRVNC